jgi:hypothetical protein
LQEFLQYIIVEFIPSIILLYFFSFPIPGIVSRDLIFSICPYVYRIFPQYSSSYTLSLYVPPTHTHCYQPSRWNLFSLPVLRFCKKRKRRHFYLFKVALEGISLWHFHVYMYFNPNWFMLSIFLFLPKSPSYGDFNRLKNSLFILV